MKAILGLFLLSCTVLLADSGPSRGLTFADVQNNPGLYGGLSERLGQLFDKGAMPSLRDLMPVTAAEAFVAEGILVRFDGMCREGQRFVSMQVGSELYGAGFPTKTPIQEAKTELLNRTYEEAVLDKKYTFQLTALTPQTVEGLEAIRFTATIEDCATSVFLRQSALSDGRKVLVEMHIPSGACLSPPHVIHSKSAYLLP